MTKRAGHTLHNRPERLVEELGRLAHDYLEAAALYNNHAQDALRPQLVLCLDRILSLSKTSAEDDATQAPPSATLPNRFPTEPQGTRLELRAPAWLNDHPDAQELLHSIALHEPISFYDDPAPAGLLLARDAQSYLMRIGALLGAAKLTAEQAAALARGMGVTILNPDEYSPPPSEQHPETKEP